MTFTKEMFKGLTVDTIYGMFGSKETRGTTNKAIRTLLSLGYTRTEVSKMLNIRYQHVRNVQLTELKRPVEVEQVEEDNGQLDLFK
jgi:hypothetical protein